MTSLTIRHLKLSIRVHKATDFRNSLLVKNLLYDQINDSIAPFCFMNEMPIQFIKLWSLYVLYYTNARVYVCRATF